MAFGLVACGGGGGGGGDNDAPVPLRQTVYYQLVAADFNTDGLMDLAAVVQLLEEGSASDSPELRVLLQRPEQPGRFTIFQSLALSAVRGALATADLDLDGWPDIVVTDERGQAVRIYLQDPNANNRFSLRETASVLGPSSIEITDVDLDGAPDVILTTPRGIRALRQDTAVPGSFPERLSLDIDSSLDPADALSSAQDSLAVGDLNHDGLVDLATVRGDGQTRVYLHDATLPGTFRPAARVAMDITLPGTVAIADLDHDGHDDLVAAGVDGGPVFLEPVLRVRRQDSLSPGTLLPVFRFDLTDEGEPRRLAIADVTGDHVPDVVVAKLYTIDHGFVEVLEQIGPTFGLRRTGVFSPLTLPGLDPNLQGLAVVDFNDDELADVAVTDRELSILFNDPAGPGRLLAAVTVISP